MFLSMQSLNGDSYQGAQVGANVQSQVGPTIKGSSWLGEKKKKTEQRREPSLSCLCTEPSTVQSEAPRAKIQRTNKQTRKKPDQKTTKKWNYDSQHQLLIDWQRCLFRFGWNILAAKIYSHPPAIMPYNNPVVRGKNMCRSIWLWLELLGWYCFFLYYYYYYCLWFIYFYFTVISCFFMYFYIAVSSVYCVVVVVVVVVIAVLHTVRQTRNVPLVIVGQKCAFVSLSSPPLFFFFLFTPFADL